MPGVAWRPLPPAAVLEDGPFAIAARRAEWRARPCPTCRVQPGDRCCTPSGREGSRPHAARLRVGRFELVSRDAVWAELERRGVTSAAVPFFGRAGAGGKVGTITLSRVDGGELVEVERWSGRDDLAYALEAPVCDRFGNFAGQPLVRATVTWPLSDRVVLIAGRRGDVPFEEVLA